MGYWAIVREKASTRTAETLSLGGGKLVISILLTAIYLVVVWFVIGADTGQSQVVLRLALTAAPFLGIPLVYSWYVLRLHPELYSELEMRVRGLEAKLEDKRDKRRIAELIAVQMMRGRDLMAKCTNTEERGRITEDECLVWQADTERLIRRELGTLEYALYETPDGDAPHNVVPDDKFLNTTWNGIRFRVNNLRGLIDDLIGRHGSGLDIK